MAKKAKKPSKQNLLAVTTMSKLRSSMAILAFVWSILRRYAPAEFRKLFTHYNRQLFEMFSPYVHLYIDEFSSSTSQLYTGTGIYPCVSAYLGEKGVKKSKRLRLHASIKGDRDFSMTDDEVVTDTYKGVTVWWVLEVTQPASKSSGVAIHAYRLTFHRSNRDFVTGEYLDRVTSEGKLIIEKSRTKKLYVNKYCTDPYTRKFTNWTYVAFHHPATFDNLAMDPVKKKAIIEDLLKFSRSKDFYKHIGKAWKRGYLLYGPPGTGKSTMIAAMANLLIYDVFDLELTTVKSNDELRSLLLSTSSRSILAIEDIDCSLYLTEKRKSKASSTSDDANMTGASKKNESTVTLSGLLNVIDGIWSSLEGEKIIVFTTNSLSELDPALIRTGRMDMHIEMSYCCFEGFKVLAKNFLSLDTHPKFEVIRCLLEETNITPADVGEYLMSKLPHEDAEKCLDNLIVALGKAKEDRVVSKKSKKAEEEDVFYNATSVLT